MDVLIINSAGFTRSTRLRYWHPAKKMHLTEFIFDLCAETLLVPIPINSDHQLLFVIP